MKTSLNYLPEGKQQVLSKIRGPVLSKPECCPEQKLSKRQDDFFRSSLWCLMFVLFIQWQSLAYAQVITDGSVGAASSLSGPNMLVTQSMGDTRGQNLFHSFSEFSIHQGESVTFESGASINNVIARVTGGEQTLINGGLFADANLFLLNPNGILVGAGATLDVAGTLNLSSADYLKFNDDEFFYANITDTSSLSIANPTAFGFLDENIGSLSIVDNDLNFSGDNGFSLVGGEIVLENGEVFLAGGNLHLVAVGSEGEVVISGDDFDASGLSAMSNVSLDEFNVVTSGSAVLAPGNIQIKSNSLLLDNQARLLTNSSVGDDGGHIAINVDSLSIEGNSSITTRVADTGRAGAAGNITIDAVDIDVLLGRIGVSTSSAGDAGNIVINADTLILDGRHHQSFFDVAEISSRTGNVNDVIGQSGNITLDVGQLNIFSNGQLVTESSSNANAGAMNINVEHLFIDGAERIESKNTGILSRVTGVGHGGDISINAQRIDLDNFGFIVSGTGGNAFSPEQTGNGGLLTIVSSDELMMDNQSVIESNTFGLGKAGGIDINAGRLQLNNLSSIQSLSAVIANNDAGDIHISAGDSVEIFNRSNISSISSQTNAGNITIDAGRLVHLSSGQIESSTSVINDGNNLLANTISISTEAFVMERQSEFDTKATISTTANGLADGSDIAINATDIRIENASEVTTTTTNIGNAGDISLVSDNTTFNDHSLIATSTSSRGAGGAIDINSVNVLIDNNSNLSVSTTGLGDAGSIVIEGKDIVLNGKSQITSSSLGAADRGDTGSVAIVASNNVTLSDGVTISSETDNSGGGNLSIVSDNIVILENSRLSTRVNGNGDNNGNITVFSKALVLNNSDLFAQANAGADIVINSLFYYQSPDSDVNIFSSLDSGIEAEFVNSSMNVVNDFVSLNEELLLDYSWNDNPCEWSFDHQLAVDRQDGENISAIDMSRSSASLLRKRFKNRVLQESDLKERAFKEMYKNNTLYNVVSVDGHLSDCHRKYFSH